MCAEVNLAAVSQDQKWIDMWLSEQQSANTRSSYRRTIARMLAMLNKTLPELTRRDLLMYRMQRTEDGLCANSRNQEMACIKSLIGYIESCDHKYLAVNVAASLKKEHVEKKRAFVPNVQQIRATLDIKMPPKVLCALKVLVYTGCRVSEVGQIRWKDMEVGGSAVNVTIHGKGLKTHVSAIPLELYRELQQQCGDNDPLLPFSRHSLYQHLKRVASKAGVEGLHPHSFRHACATYLMNAGVPAYLVKEHLGHSQIETTLDYVNITPSDRITSTMKTILEGSK
jgi:integrase/recombinase XerD